MMNAESCAETCCGDVHDVIRARKLRGWAESDAKFLRKLSVMEHYDNVKSERRVSSLVFERSESFERFRGRQRFLRSYPFDKEKEKETIMQKTKKWLKMKKPKEKAKKGNCSNSPLKACVKFLLSCTTWLDVHDLEELICVTRKF